MYEFILDGKPEKIKRDILTMGYENGGLKMIDIDNFIKALKVCWIKRIIEADNDSILNRIYIYNLRAFGGRGDRGKMIHFFKIFFSFFYDWIYLITFKCIIHSQVLATT